MNNQMIRLIIKEELKRVSKKQKTVNEGLFDLAVKFTGYINKVVMQGRAAQVAKEIDDENPELAMAMKNLEKAQTQLDNIIQDQLLEDPDRMKRAMEITRQKLANLKK